MGVKRQTVFSTSVEVFPIEQIAADLCGRLLHVRGGVSLISGRFWTQKRSSPRPWRCFHRANELLRFHPVFSTSVEVFLDEGCTEEEPECLLHVRGGVSRMGFDASLSSSSSPRPWRCFHFSECTSRLREVFSTSVEVFLRSSKPTAVLRCLLHVRGGVSDGCEPEASSPASSPRPWRCFYGRVLDPSIRFVFSTSVEVFPLEARSKHKRTSLLHVRGGVSLFLTLTYDDAQSSPRPWRCF